MRDKGKQREKEEKKEVHGVGRDAKRDGKYETYMTCLHGKEEKKKSLLRELTVGINAKYC